MLLITHDMGVIAGRTDRVVVMYGGKKAEEATTERLFTAMRHPYTQALLASMPNLENTSKHDWPRSRACRRTSPRRSWAVVSRRGARTRPTSAARTSRPSTVRATTSSRASTRWSVPQPVVVRVRGRATSTKVKIRTGDPAGRGPRQGVPDQGRARAPQGRSRPRRLRRHLHRSTRARPSVSSASRDAARRRLVECSSGLEP